MPFELHSMKDATATRNEKAQSGLPRNAHVEILRMTKARATGQLRNALYGGRGRGYFALLRRGSSGSVYAQEVIRPGLDLMRQLRILDPPDEIDVFPPGAFRITIRFQLLTPWRAQGAEPFWIHDRALSRDEVFKVPEMPATMWKGWLRAVAESQVGEDNRRAVQIERLFGAGASRAGRLSVEPTFFDEISVSVVQPVSREKGQGGTVILEEQCPAGAAGTFRATYIPSADARLSRAEQMAEGVEDLSLFGATLVKVLHDRGFSAGVSKGFGLAKERYELVDEHRRRLPGGKLEMRGINFQPVQPRGRFAASGQMVSPSCAVFSSPQELMRLIEYAKRFLDRMKSRQR